MYQWVALEISGQPAKPEPGWTVHVEQFGVTAEVKNIGGQKVTFVMREGKSETFPSGWSYGNDEACMRFARSIAQDLGLALSTKGVRENDKLSWELTSQVHHDAE